MNKNNFLIIDFDSTFVKLETLEEIAEEALEGNSRKDEIKKKIENITNDGMRGKISFAESLQDRLALFSANKKEVKKVSQKIAENISDSFLKNIDFFKKHGKQIFIISGGFRECIFSVSDQFGIPRKNVLANEFVFDENDQVIGVEKDNFLSQDQGKVKQVKALKLEGQVFAIGDGWTDYEIKKEGQADYFLAYTENISRQKVVAEADCEVKNFDQVIEFVELNQILKNCN